jgi:hypothetical protein
MTSNRSRKVLILLILWLVAAVAWGQGDIAVTSTQHVYSLKLDAKVLLWTIQPANTGATIVAAGDAEATATCPDGTFAVTAWTTAGTGRVIRVSSSPAPGPGPEPKPTDLPKIELTALPPKIQAGGSATLVIVSPNAETVTVDHGVGAVKPIDAVRVTPTKTIEYTATATNKQGAAVAKTTLVVGDGPVPPPDPVDPPPLPVTGLHVCILEETADRAKLPATTREVLLGTGPGSVRDWLTKNCAKDAVGRPQFRVLDASAEPTKDDQVWRDAWKRPRQGLPWIVIGNSKTGFEGPLPGTPAEVIELLRKYGG